MVKGDEGPVGHDAANVPAASDDLLARVLAHDEVLGSGGIVELDVGPLQERRGGVFWTPSIIGLILW